MAGRGERMKSITELPKPLIEVGGKPMFLRVVESLNLDGQYIFAILQEHDEVYGLATIVKELIPGAQIHFVNAVTEGQAVTVLNTLEEFSQFTNDEMLTANCDQLVAWNSDTFLHLTSEGNDGVIATYNGSNPNWSYAEVDEHNTVIRTAEKSPISPHATVGLYNWKCTSDYIRYTKQMIHLNKRVRNEFYVCPVYNEAIADGRRFIIYPVRDWYHLGTADDLTRYQLENHLEERFV